MKRPIVIGFAVALPLSLGACASSNAGTLDAGERLSQRGDVIGAYGKAWSDGQKDVVQATEERLRKFCGDSLPAGGRLLERGVKKQVAVKIEQLALHVVRAGNLHHRARHRE